MNNENIEKAITKEREDIVCLISCWAHHMDEHDSNLLNAIVGDIRHLRHQGCIENNIIDDDVPADSEEGKERISTAGHEMTSEGGPPSNLYLPAIK
jgi:hypothetical protein